MRLKSPWPLALHYGVAIAAVMLALLLTLLIPTLGEHTPFILFFPAVLVAAWFGGLGPALVATGLSTVAVDYFLLPPTSAFGPSHTTVLLLGVFVAVSVFLSTLHTILRRERTRFAVTLASIGDAVIATDTQGRVTYMNPVAEALTGWRAGEALGQDLAAVFRIVNMETRAAVESPVAKVLREGAVVGLANHTVLLARDGTERPIDDSGAPVLEADGRLAGMVLVFRDVSARRQAEQALRQSEARFRTLTTVAPVGIFLTDVAGDYLFVNERWSAMAGLSPDETGGLGWVRALHPEDRERIFQEWYAAVKTGDEFSSEYRFQTAEGRVTWLAGTAVPLTDEHGTITGYLGAVTDITARMRTENELRRAAALLELTHEAILVLDLEETIIMWNRGAAELYGWAPEEAIGRVAYRLLQTRFPQSREAIKAELLARGRWEGDLAQTRRDGSSLVVASRWALQRDTDGQPLAFLEINSDITARRRAEAALEASAAQLRASLQEKEVLLKEIHHRVKNNLQVIASLLSLQQDLTADPQALALFEESARRISSIALVHETLYQRDDLAAFDLAAYIRTLSDQLTQAYGVDAQRVALRLELDAVALPLDMAVPCGLMLNELFSNCLKHAFPDGRAGAVTVSLAREADRVLLTVRDSGCGFPEQLDFRTTESLGLQLVCALTEQLRGTIALERGGGTAFTVTFPLPSDRGDEAPSAGAP
jgi:PAS domain S-box-containing protein